MVQNTNNPAILQELNTGKHGDCISGIPSGFTELDRITGGWRPGELIIVASRPSMGKTAFALSMARNMAMDFGYGVAFFSLEMSTEHLFRRMIVSETGLDSEKIRSGNLEPHERELYDATAGKLTDAPIFVDDMPALSVSEFRDKCRNLVQMNGIRIAFIDYLQLMNWTHDKKITREQETTNILCSLKDTAKELNIPVVVLAQLNNEIEKRPGLQGKRPQLADFRDIRAEVVEQNVDIVAFILRPEYYGYTEDEHDNSLAGVAEIIIAKNRNGAPGDVRLVFDANFAKFMEKINHLWTDLSEY
jgi:replicative DNA helicase